MYHIWCTAIIAKVFFSFFLPFVAIEITTRATGVEYEQYIRKASYIYRGYMATRSQDED